jgi:hypothetical protein
MVALGYLVKLWRWAGYKVASWKCGAQEIEVLGKNKRIVQYRIVM